MDIEVKFLPATTAQAPLKPATALPLSTRDASPFEVLLDRTLLVKLLEYMLEVEPTSRW